MKPAAGCPFHSAHGGVSLVDLPGIVRCGDGARYRVALMQLEQAILRTTDLDEARGEALTFIAMATAATLEMGAPRATHRIQLEAARRMDQTNSAQGVVEVAKDVLSQVLNFDRPKIAEMLIQQALEIIDRQFSAPITDAYLAREVGLSTSHFRHLFREVTGRPVNKYLISTRLEKARGLLVNTNMPVSEVALTVGFATLAHFSRAFTQRFAASPSDFRRSGMATHVS